jgi:hypothetical protein
VADVGDWRDFRPCQGCGFNIATGEGERGCAWGECAYLPAQLDVFCPNCRYNFLTREGNSQCGHPGACENAVEPRSNVANLREWLELRRFAW